MTKLVAKVFSEVSKLPEVEQDAIAAWLLEELASERRWQTSFRKSRSVLASMAAEATAEYREGGRRSEAMKYTVIIERGHESGYVTYVPALKGCVSQGKTRAEALKNVREAMEAYVAALMEDGLPVPTEEGKDVVELAVTAR